MGTTIRELWHAAVGQVRRPAPSRAMVLLFALVVAGMPWVAFSPPAVSAYDGIDHGQVAATQATRTCSTAFEVTIHDGPTAPLMLAGGLTLQIEPSGSFVGTLNRRLQNADEVEPLGVLPARDIPVVGQVNGHAINMLFDLGDGAHVYGVGTAESDLNACDGVIPGTIGGPAVGPGPGDRGDWEGRPRLQLCVPGFYCVILLW